jgi:hypothetical protein
MQIVRHNETVHFFPDDVSLILPEDYADDPQAYYDEHHVAHYYDRCIYNFWGTIEIQVPYSTDEDLIKVVEAMRDMETKIGEYLP